MNVYVVTEYCCNHFDGVFGSKGEVFAKYNVKSVGELEEKGYSVSRYAINVRPV